MVGAAELDEVRSLVLDQLDAGVVFDELPERRDAHGAEHQPGAGLTLLTGFDDLGCRHALGEREVRLDHQRAPQDNDEEHPEHAADAHDEHGVAEVELGPRAGDQKGRDGEDGPGDQRFTDRGGGPRQILLEDVAAEDPQRRHRDHCRREGGRHGETDLHPEVGVGGAEDDRHDHAQQQGLDRKLRHRRLGRHVGNELLLRHETLPLDWTR